MSNVEQLKAKRAGTGLRGHDSERAYAGYTLFTPISGDGTVYVIDMEGRVIHTWRMPYVPGQYGYLTDTGHLFYNGQIQEPAVRFKGWELWKAGVALEADWDGNIRWEVRHPDHHHDGRRLRNGNVLLLCATAMPRDLVPRVRGGLLGTEADGDMWADYLVEMTTTGEVVWEWRSWEHLDPESDRITGPDRRDEWTHGNTAAEMPDGSVIASFRHISTVVVVDRTSGQIVWKLGAPPLAQQHAPTPLPNGNVLIFDNGMHRVDHPVSHSRILEVELATKKIVWSYQERRLYDFFSPYISNAQRLPNGNTLICEGCSGRLFEVTTDGELVWEFVNPHFAVAASTPNGVPSNEVFRAYRYSAAEIDRARRTATSG